MQEELGTEARCVRDYQIKKCSLIQLGYRVKRCGLNLNRIPEWTADDSMCVLRYPSKNVSLVDTTFSISGFSFDTYESLFKIISMYAMRDNSGSRTNYLSRYPKHKLRK